MQDTRPPHSVDMYMCNFYLLGMLRDEEYRNNPCTKVDLQESIQNTEFSISRAELRHAMNNMFVTCDAHLQSKQNHVQHFI
jgi:hypothetical protein